MKKDFCENQKIVLKFQEKRSWLVCALDASECILKNMLHTTVIKRLPMDSLKGLGPSGFDPMKKISKLSVPQPIR